MIIDIQTVPTAYINLDVDTEKRKRMEELLKDFRTPIRVRGVIPEPHEGVSQAVARAHKIALNIFPATMALILEDDCIPYSYRSQITVPDDADLVYLGLYGTPIFKPVEEYNDVVRLIQHNGAHAILYITEAGKDQLRWAVDMCVAIDHFHDCLLSSRLHKINAYALRTPIFAQSSKMGLSCHQI